MLQYEGRLYTSVASALTGKGTSLVVNVLMEFSHIIQIICQCVSLIGVNGALRQRLAVEVTEFTSI